MTKRTKKPAKGVPMPRPLRWFECGWFETSDGKIAPTARLIPWLAIGVLPNEIPAEHARVMAWLANPATPKGVRR